MKPSSLSVQSCLIAAAAGYFGTTLQILLLQESLAAGRNNELCIAVVLGLWLIATGAGSFAGSRLSLSPRIIRNLPLLLAVLLPFTLAAFRAAPAWLKSTPGEIPGIRNFTIIPLITMIPFCLLNGMLFALTVNLIRRSGSNHPGIIYISESLGALTGAVLTHLIHPLSSSTLILAGVVLIMGIPLLAGIGMHGVSVRFKLLNSSILSVVPILMIGTTLVHYGQHLSLTLDASAWPGHTIRQVFDSVYGRWHLIEYQDGLSLFYNRTLITHGAITRPDEETAVVALALHPNPVNILLLDGVWTHMATITGQFPGADVEAVALDMFPLTRLKPEDLARVLPRDEMTNLRFHSQDPRIALDSAPDHRFDIIISCAPLPLSLNASRYYSIDFYREIERVLATNGIFGMTISGSENMMSPEQVRFAGMVFRSIRSVFSHDAMTVIPGDTIHIFIHPDTTGPVPVETILHRIAQSGISSLYPIDAYLPYTMSPQALQTFQSALDEDTFSDCSTDLRPLILPVYLNLWHSQWQSSINSRSHLWLTHIRSVALITLFIAIPLHFLLNRRKAKVMLAVSITGSVAMITQILLMFMLQLRTGALYHEAGLLIGLFALGLSIGSALTGRLTSIRPSRIALVQFGLGLLLIGLMITTNQRRDIPVEIIFLSSLLCAALCGSQFVLASREYPDHLPCLYFMDLAGAAVSALIVAIFFLPVAGIPMTGFFFGGLILISGSFLLRRAA
ncbi:hypothetical protein JW823_08845 [bacterium]|nr:hypothetical protein [candidate division CSSED10-310 bacterium]